jgi:hypothetical protein
MNSNQKLRTESSRPAMQLTAQDSIIDVRVLLSALWDWKWLVLVFALLGSMYGFWQVHKFVPHYTVTMTVIPTTVQVSAFEKKLSSLSEITGGFGGIGGSGGSSEKFDRFEYMLRSIKLAELLQEKQKLMQRVWASSWDAGSNSWLRPRGEKFEQIELYKKFFNMRAWSEPNLDTFSKFIGGAISIGKVPKKNFRTLSVVHTDPDLAMDVLVAAYQGADDLVREQDRKQSDLRKQYIQQQLEQQIVLERRNPLLGMLESEERFQMMLNSEKNYTNLIFEPPRLLRNMTEPNTLKLLGFPIAASVFMALLFSILMIVFRHEDA